MLILRPSVLCQACINKKLVSIPTAKIRKGVTAIIGPNRVPQENNNPNAVTHDIRGMMQAARAKTI
jgi:hypothetical protein